MILKLSGIPTTLANLMYSEAASVSSMRPPSLTPSCGRCGEGLCAYPLTFRHLYAWNGAGGGWHTPEEGDITDPDIADEGAIFAYAVGYPLRGLRDAERGS